MQKQLVTILSIVLLAPACELFHRGSGTSSAKSSISGKNVGAEKLLSADEKSIKKIPKYKMQKKLVYDTN